jgi:hypothetical protein
VSEKVWKRGSRCSTVTGPTSTPSGKQNCPGREVGGAQPTAGRVRVGGGVCGVGVRFACVVGSVQGRCITAVVELVGVVACGRVWSRVDRVTGYFVVVGIPVCGKMRRHQRTLRSAR